MNNILIIENIEEIQQNIELISKRLYYILKNLKHNNAEEEMNVLNDFILEMIKVIETESFNALQEILLLKQEFCKKY